jgi:hypothetical protein
MSSPPGTKEITAKVATVLDNPLTTALITIDKALAAQTQTFLPLKPPFDSVGQRN